MVTIPTPWRQSPLTQEEQDLLFMLSVDDDTEDAPWMVMGDLQFWSTSSLAHSLRIYGRRSGLRWYVASMLPIDYEWPGVERKKTVAPDVFVSFVEDHPRTSYDLTAEGLFPAFVLEVVSPSSVARDLVEKLNIYTLLGAQEYAIFTPNARDTPLQGYLHSGEREMKPWPLDEQGRLWSETLGLYLTVNGATVQAVTRDGQLLLSPEQEEVARRRAEQERAQAEAEVERLRAELERYKEGDLKE